MNPCRQPSFAYRLFEPVWSILLRRCVERRLRAAVCANHLSLVSRLLDTGRFQVNAPVETLLPSPSDRPRGHKDFRLLHLAATRGLFEMAELLISHGADPTIKTSWNISPMHLAAYEKHAHVVALLAANGGQVMEVFPCLSTYWEEDPYTPNTLEILVNVGVNDYSGNEHGQYRSIRDGAALQSSTPASAATVSSPRL